MFLTMLRTLVFGTLIANELLPASAKNEFPRTHRRDKRSASLLSSLLIPYKESQRASRYEIRPFRKSGKIFIIALEPESPVVKNLKKLPFEKIYDDELKHSFGSKFETEQYENIVKPKFDLTETNELDRLLSPKFKPMGTQPVEVLQFEHYDRNPRIIPTHDSSETKSIETWPSSKVYDQNGRLKPVLDSLETKNAVIKKAYNKILKRNSRFTSSEAKTVEKLEKLVANAKHELPETKMVDLSGKNYDKKASEAKYNSFEEKNLKMALDKLFDDDGMLYLTKPKEKRVKKMLRNNEDLVNKFEKTPKIIANSKTMFNFSDLVL